MPPTYADGAPEVAPLKPWPDPAGGFRLRHYDLGKITKSGSAPSEDARVSVDKPDGQRLHAMAEAA